MTGTTAGVGDRRQVDPPHAVLEFLGQLTRGLDGEARLTCTACTGECDEPVVAQQRADLVDLTGTSDEAGELRREIMGACGFRGAKWREFVADVGVAELNHPLGPRQIADRVGAEFSQPGFVRNAVQYQIGGGAGQHGLSAVCQDRECVRCG